MDATCKTLLDAVGSAMADKRPLRFRGGGSKDFYGNKLLGEVLDTRVHSGIVSYEPSELVVTARCGTSLAELEAVLAEKGQSLAFEPPHFSVLGLESTSQQPHFEGSSATVGGMVAAGLSGQSRASVGSVRDFVLGAHFINGQGELLEFGGQVMKNVAGYDVSRLLAGSMGTLGLITQVSLKVLPVAPAEATVMFEMDEATAIRRLNEWSGTPLPLNASNWVCDTTSGQPKNLLFVRLRGAKAAVSSAVAKFVREGAQHMDSDEASAANIRRDWLLSRDMRQPWFLDGFARGDDLWRLSVPSVTAPLNVGDTFVEWLGAQRWVWCAPGDTTRAAQIRAAAIAAGGSASLFKGQAKQEGFAFGANSNASYLIAKRLKTACDPHGIFNPQRLYAEF
jgi:glycolate oxidase FAD binding subunit